jgi:hypothetical protein
LVTFLPGPTRPLSCRLLWFFLLAADERGMDEGARNPGPSQLGGMRPRTGTRQGAEGRNLGGKRELTRVVMRE